MGVIEGSSTAEIVAPIETCYEHAADLERISEWQGGVQRVQVLERDDEGRGTLADISTDAKVRTVTTRVRFTHGAPAKLSWRQEKGDLKSLDGSWTFEDLGGGRTRATYHLVGDPGRVLGMLVRGPVEGMIRGMLVGARAEELKARAEGG